MPKRITSLVLLLAAVLCAGAWAQSDKAAGGTGPAKAEEIEIEADRLETNNREKYAEFIGGVRARQGERRLSADRLRIYYEGEMAQGGGKKSPANEDMKIKKIVAFGNVHIVSEDYTAVTSRAEYEVGTQVLTLIGENSKVIQGKNQLIGSKITLHQADGRMRVDGSSDQRVKVIFFPEGKEADFLKKPDRKPAE